MDMDLEKARFIEKYIETTDVSSTIYSMRLESDGGIKRNKVIGQSITNYNIFCKYCNCSVPKQALNFHIKEHLKELK